MADNNSSKHTHEWMALTMWLGLLLVTLLSTIFIAASFQFGSEWIINLSPLFTQAQQIPGVESSTFFKDNILYVILLLFVGVVYFLVTSWLKLGSMLLEVLIDYSREEGGGEAEPIFSMFLYLSGTKDSGDGFDPDDAEGSMPGDVIKNLSFAWIAMFVIFAIVSSIPYLV